MGCCNKTTPCRAAERANDKARLMEACLNATPNFYFSAHENNVEISFGPKNEYALHIPLKTFADRAKIIKQLRTAADKLEIKPVTPKSTQTVFPFLT